MGLELEHIIIMTRMRMRRIVSIWADLVLNAPNYHPGSIKLTTTVSPYNIFWSSQLSHSVTARIYGLRHFHAHVPTCIAALGVRVLRVSYYDYL